MSLRDNPRSYGIISRLLHWTMAVLFVWQFAGMLLKDVLGRGPVSGVLVGSHASVGLTLLVLLIIRAAWALSQGTRPPHRGGSIGFAAKMGHWGLYLLMLVVPSLALLRAIGGDRGINYFGLQLMAPGSPKVEWMTAPANLLHGNLAWVLLALIAGHVLMVGVHHFLWRDDTLSRMAGRR